MLAKDDNVPVLNNIVQTGNQSVIDTRSSHKQSRDQDIDRRIDKLIEKHMTALRVDIKIALLAHKSDD